MISADSRRRVRRGSMIDGKSVITHLTEMYSRSDRFPECLRLLLERGAELDDPRIGPVLLDDADGLAAALRRDPSLIEHRTSMVSAFTPLDRRIAASCGRRVRQLQAARVLIDMGADVNARAAVDEHGLNGHTPSFHTVNSNANRSAPLMRLLLDAGAQPRRAATGHHLGKGHANGRRRSSTSRRSPTHSSVFYRRCIATSATSTTTSGCCSSGRALSRRWTTFLIATFIRRVMPDLQMESTRRVACVSKNNYSEPSTARDDAA